MRLSNAYARTRENILSDTRNILVIREAAGQARLARLLALILAPVLGATLLFSCRSSGTPITLEITPNVAQTVDQGQIINYTAILGNDTRNRGVTWTLTGTGCAGSGCGTLTNITPTSVVYTAPTSSSTSLSVSLKAASLDSSATMTSTITVVLPPSFTTTTLPNGSNGVPYNAPLTVTGGVAPLVFTVSCPNNQTNCLPPGLTLNQTGVLIGKPASTGTFTFNIKVTDNGAVPQANGSAPPLSVLSPSYTVIINPAQPLTVTTTALPVRTVNAAYNGTLSSQGGVAPFTWSISQGSLPPGLSLDASTGQISGIPTVAGSYPIVATVQDSTLPTPQTASSSTITIVIQAAQALQINTTSLPGGMTATPYNAKLIATGGVPPYTWSVIAGQLPSGLVLNARTGTITGIPVLVTNTNFTVQVQDSAANTSAPQTLGISVTPGSNSNSLLSGSYSFLFNGYDSNGTVLMAGNVSADGKGHITTGTADSNRIPGASGGPGVFAGSAVTGTYSLGTDGRGAMQLTVTNTSGGVFIGNYLLALDSTGNVHFIEADTTGANGVGITHGTGIMKPMIQTSLSAANFSGHYAFEFSGQDFSANPIALVGRVFANGAQDFSSGTLDYNDAGSYSPQLPLSGNFQLGSANGRGLATFVFQLPSNAQITLTFDFFFVSPSDILFMEVDIPSATSPLPRLSGEMVLQRPTTQFNLGTLDGSGVATGTGLDSNATVFAGLLATDGNGNATFTYDQNDGGNVTLLNSASGSYQVDQNGRAAFNGLGSRLAAVYLTGPNQGFLIGSDSAVTYGLLEQQTIEPSFTQSSVQGGYTLSAPFIADSNVVDMIGQLNSTGLGSLTGTLDEFIPPSTLNTDATFFANYSFPSGSNGRGTMTTNPLNGFPTNLVFYVVSPASIRMISLDSPGNGQPEVIFLDH